MNEYMIVFPSSFYLVAYARDRLQRAGVSTTLTKTPAQLFGSCGYGLSLICDKDHVEYVKEIMRQDHISWKAIYRLENERGIFRYKSI